MCRLAFLSVNSMGTGDGKTLLSPRLGIAVAAAAGRIGPPALSRPPATLACARRCGPRGRGSNPASGEEASMNTDPAPQGYPTVSPYLSVTDAAGLIEFLVKVFD